MIWLRLIAPDVVLRPYIKTYWHLKIDDNEVKRQTIVPSGMTGLCFFLNQEVLFDGYGALRTSIGGQQMKSMLTYSRGLEAIGVEFRTCGAHLFYSTPVTELFGMILSPQQLNDHKIIELEERIMTARSTVQCMDILDEFFINRLQRQQPDCLSLKRIQSSLLLSSAKPNATVSELASAACLGSKQYRRVFTQHVGMMPKQYLRINRLKHAISDILNSAGKDDRGQAEVSSMTATAWRSGYYDLPHMNTDFREVLGCCPSEIIRNYRPENFSWVDIRVASNNIKYLHI